MPLGVSTAVAVRVLAARGVGVTSEADRIAGARADGVLTADNADEESVVRGAVAAEEVKEARGRGIVPVAAETVEPAVAALGVGRTPAVLPVRDVLGLGIDLVAVGVFIDGGVPALAADRTLFGVPVPGDTILERPGVTDPREGSGGTA